MKKVFTVAVLLTLCSLSMAGTVSVTKQTHSLEGLNGVTAKQLSNKIPYTLAEDYLVGDKIIQSYPAGLVSSLPSTFNINAVNNTQGTSLASLASKHVTPITVVISAPQGPTTSTRSVSSGSASAILEVIGQKFSEVSINDKDTDTAKGIQFPLGAVSFSVTSATGGSVDVDVNFLESLPSDGFFLYKVDVAGNTTLSPSSLWTKQGNKGIRLKLTDGGPFDLDELANGVIVDRIAVGTATSDQLETLTFSSVANLPSNQWINSNLAIIRGLSQETEMTVEGGFISIDAGNYTIGPVTVGLGQSVRVLIKSSENAEESTTATLKLGDYTTSFTVSTASKSLNQAIQYGNACSQSSVTTVLKAYIAYYNRPADVGGLNFWSCEIDKQEGALDSFLSNFVNTPEFAAQYGGLNDSQVIDKLYQQLFKRDPDIAGKAYWLNALASGNTSYENIPMAIINGTIGNETTIINNKLLVAEYFIEQLGKNGINTTGFLGIMDQVTNSLESVVNAKAIIDGFINTSLTLENSL